MATLEPRKPHMADGKFKHPCMHPGCTRDGCYGRGCDSRRVSKAIADGDPDPMRFAGQWWCAEHVPPEFWAGKRQAEQHQVERAAAKAAPAQALKPLAADKKRTQFKDGQGVLL